MINSIYQILAIGLKYWFILVAIIMLWLIISTSRREYRERRSLLGQLGNYIGYLEIVGGLQGEKGTRIGISRENTIGSGKTVDIVIRDRSVEREHAFLYLKGNGSDLDKWEKSKPGFCCTQRRPAVLWKCCDKAFPSSGTGGL